jgi:Domain of unknown function (DUF6285)
MLEQPDGANLLATAREMLLRELLPHLPEAQKFHARMVANAMAIAGREGAADPAPALGALREALAAPEAATPDALLRRLAAEIRAGRHDPGTPRHAAVAAALAGMVRLRCSVSAPKALGRQGGR